MIAKRKKAQAEFRGEEHRAQTQHVQERGARFRILTVEGRRRAFAIEPIFWFMLEKAAEESSMRLGEFVSSLLVDASRSNHSALLRVKAAEWAEKRREELRRKEYLSIGRRIAASHDAPAFLLDQTGSIAAHNQAFAELLHQRAAQIEEQAPLSFRLRLGAVLEEMMGMLRDNPHKFLRVRFSLLVDGLQRDGVLNAMFVGEEDRGTFALCLIQSINEARQADEFHNRSAGYAHA